MTVTWSPELTIASDEQTESANVGTPAFMDDFGANIFQESADEAIQS